MTQYMARSAWTTAARGGAQLTGTKLVGIAIHWPGTSQNAFGVQSASLVAARLRGYWDYHVNTRGWVDIGYNMAIDQAGRVWDLRGLSRVGAHCASTANPDANHEWVGVLFLLGDEERPSAAMIRAFQDFRYDVFLPRWPGRAKLTGHGRAPGVPGAQTSCCGPYAAAKITDGTLAQRATTQEDDDMPTAKEIADAVWAHPHRDPRAPSGTPADVNMEVLLDRMRKDTHAAQGLLDASIDNRVLGTTIKVRDSLAFTHEDGHQINAKLDEILAGDGALDVDALAEAIAAKIPPGAVDLATVKQGVREVLIEGIGS
jgi:hypothetical protein